MADENETHDSTQEVSRDLTQLLSRMRVLLVEDNALDARLVERRLLQENELQVEVTRAGSLQESIQKLRSEAVHIVLLDLRLPDTAGVEAVRLINEEAPWVPIVVMSGCEDKQLLMEAMRLGAHDIIGKDNRDEKPLLPRLARAVRKQRGHTRAAYHALHDGLTGLPNHLFFEERVSASVRDQEEPAVAIVNVDELAALNNKYGMRAGDRILQTIGGRLQHAVRDGTLVARLDGDTFAVMLLDVDDEELAHERTEHLQRALAPSISVGEHNIHVSVSMGFAAPERSLDSAQELMSAAREALLKSKKAGKNRSTLWTQHNSQIGFRERFRAEVHQALENDEFVLYYQPQIDLAEGTLAGAEALIRWQTPNGLKPPLEFIPYLEEFDLIGDVGAWVIRAACKQLNLWRELNLHNPVAVNVSPKQLAREDLVLTVADALTKYDIHQGQLHLELTESALLANSGQERVYLSELRSLGVRLALDDFGTGYSSLSHLTEFPIDTLKIDRSFVSNLHESPTHAAIVTAIVQMGQALGLETVAEGIETLHQADFLRARGCQFGQGYLLAKPMPANAFTDWALEQFVDDEEDAASNRPLLS